MPIASDNPSELILPPVIVWDPYLSIPSLSLQCVECNQSIERKAWKLGQSPALEPRLIHGIESNVILVSSQYICSNSHIFLTTDPRVLNLLSSDYVPFILLHRTGFVRSFLDCIIGLIGEGLRISAVERFICNQRHVNTARIATQVMGLHPIPTALSILESPYPSNDVLYKCFLAEFTLNCVKYSSVMSKILSHCTISFDHTFKVASNIGYLRSDGKWITQYNSVFIVMNEHGEVMAWQFTKSTSMDEVKELLIGVKERTSPEVVILADNCCSIRRKLAEVFTENTTIKLDLFHAVQRITKTMPKRHPLYSLCVEDLRLVFRHPHDLSYKRQQPTPAATTILENLNKFVKKWELCNINGWKVINDNSLKEIKSLEIHINKGCLSQLPLGTGTNRNERLHRHIKPHFSCTRLGLPLALALMTVLLYQHNSAVQRRKSGMSYKPVSVLKETTGICYKFGIVDKKFEQALENPKFLGTCTNYMTLDHPFFKNAAKTVVLSDNVSQIITIVEIMSIIETAVHLANATELMKSQSGSSSTMQYRFFPFMSSVSSLFFSNINSSASDSSTLDSVIAAWEMKRVPIDGDGNCCFVAIAHGLQLLKRRNSADSLNQHLDFNCIKNLSQQLRQIVVKEWRDNTEYYSDFLVDCDIKQEADKFLQSGFFASDLGDTVLLGIANALGIQFIVFTSQECHPVIHVTPQQIICGTPIYLAYSHTGSGHYDAVIQKTAAEPLPNNVSKIAHCKCGINKATDPNSQDCVPMKSKYTLSIRCSCLKQNKKCTVLCKCKHCGNGKEEIKTTTEPLRKRRRYDHQILYTKSADFGLQRGEAMSQGARSVLEFFVLEGILKFCNVGHTQHDVGDSILLIYSTIVEITDSFDEKLPIGQKSDKDILCFLREHQHNLDAFTALCNTQLQLNNINDL